MEGDILPLPFIDGAFTLVVTQATFHHFADPAAVLAEMIRVCAAGGRIAVIDLTPAAGKIENFDRIEKLRDPSHMRTMPPESLRALGHAAGLEELDFWPYWTPMPAEGVLASSVCDAETLAKVRALYREDCASGEDRIGLGLHEEEGAMIANYPMTITAWRKAQ
jgi:SAM-dependent methyltransferase